MALYTAGTAFLQVAPSMRGFHNEVRNQLRTMNLNAEVELKPKVNRTSFEAAAREAKPKDQTVTVKADVDAKSFGSAANQVALLSRNIASLGVIPAGILAATPLILDLGAAAVQASTSLLLVPAAGAAFATVLGTMKLATAGFGAAMKDVLAADPKKFNEAIKDLSPNARAAALEVRGLRPEILGLKNLVQDAFFQNFNATIRETAQAYLPTLRFGLAGTADELRILIQNTLAFVNSAQTVSDVGTIFDNTRNSVFAMNGVGVDAVLILRDIATVGSEFLPGLASGFQQAADRVALFVNNARETGQLRQWIADGLSTLSDLISTIVNLGAVAREVFRAMNLDGQGVAATLKDITAGWREWAASAEGQTQLATFFATLLNLGRALQPLFIAVGAAIIGTIMTVGPQLPGLITGLTDVLAAARPITELFLRLALLALPPLGAALSILAPILGPLVATMVIAAAAQKAWAVATGIAEGVQLAYNTAVTIGKVAQLAYMVATQAGTRSLLIMTVAQRALNLAMALNPIGLVVIAIGLLVAAFVLAWNNSETFRAIVTAAWDGIKAAAGATWEFLKGVWAWLAAQVTAAGAWFTALGATIAGAWAGITSAVSTAWGWLVANVWDPMVTFVTVTIPAAWNQLVEALRVVWNGIVEVIRFAVTLILTVILLPFVLFWEYVLGPKVQNFYANIWVPVWNGIQAVASAIWNWVRDNVFQPIADWITNILVPKALWLRDQTVAAWNGLRDGVNAVWQWILANIWQPIVNFIDQWLVPKANFLRDATVLAWQVMQAGINAAWQIILNAIWRPIVDYIDGVLIPKFYGFRDGAIAAWNSARDGILAVWNFIRDNIWNPLVRFITVTIPDAFSAGVAAIGRLWDGIKKALRDPVQAAINVVYNNGIVKVWNWVADITGARKLTEYQLPGFAEGGAIRGGIPGKDSVPLLGQDGEYIFSRPAVDAMGGINAVDALHRAAVDTRRRAGSPIASRAEFARGGPVKDSLRPAGTGDLITSGLNLLGSWWDAATNAVDTLVGQISGTEWGRSIVGFGRKLAETAMNWLKEKVASFLATTGGGAGGGGIVAGNVGAMMATLRGAFPGLALISGFRPGAITATGNQSYHALGRAVDVPPRWDVFNWIKANYGANTKELIFSPAGGGQIWNGRPHFYGEPTRGDHWDHVHWAMDSGGLGAGRGIMLKDVIEPERVLSPRQTQAFEELVGHLAGGRGRVLRSDGVDTATGRDAAGSGPYIGQVVVPVPEGANVDQTIDAIMTRARHEGKRRGRYGRP